MIDILVVSKLDLGMEWVRGRMLLTCHHMKESISMIKQMEKDYIFGLMVIDMKVNGGMGCFMGSGRKNAKTGLFMMVSGETDCPMEKGI